MSRVTELVVLLTDFQSNYEVAWLFILFGLYFIATHDNARLKCFDLKLYEQRPREDWDAQSILNLWTNCQFMLYSQGDPRGRGPFGLRWVPSPAPALRKGIQSETRSVSFLAEVIQR